MALRGDCFRIGRVVRLALAAVLSASALWVAYGPAEAHTYRHHRYYYAHRVYPRHVPRAYAHYVPHVPRARSHYARGAVAAVPVSPAFSAIVVDANSGKTLYAASEDGLRHPASITKVMTLYLLFEQLEKGSISLRTQIPISDHAAAQEPSKLGLAPGATISVEDAIKAVVTRSANDVAVAIAEAIGHDEDSFAEMMTRKAHALGMSNTLYRNASGLPNDDQVTTARDLSVLGRAIEERFPHYFRYFSTSEFEYAGEVIGNHNHLLGRVDGVDGIKTGYTRASGFNLLTSVHRDGRSLIAVVMGGRSAGARDQIMVNLIGDHLAEASTSHTATLIADASPVEETGDRARSVEAPPPRPHLVAIATNPTGRVAAARSVEPPIAEGDNAAEDEIVPPVQVAAIAPADGSAPAQAASIQAIAKAAPVASLELGGATNADRVGGAITRQAAHPAETSKLPTPRAKSQASAAGRAVSAKARFNAPSPTPDARPVAHGRTRVDNRDAATGSGGWIVQVGATDNENKANALLARARDRNRMLASAKPVTEKVRRGQDVLYRARFAGLDSASAESACRSLKRDGFSCFAARD
jgi:D-alanyl-D-alanine carboxypeptidase